jgi:hypothetical protein
MLILDKQKAVERMLALADVHGSRMDAEAVGASWGHGRAYTRIAVYERRASIEGAPARRSERRSGLLRPAGGAPSFY